MKPEAYSRFQEEFLKRMIQAGYRGASATRRNIVNYTDMGVFWTLYFPSRR